MDIYLLMAGTLAFLLGIVHSVLGERMIFRLWKKETNPTVLRRYRGILWATWHLVTFFGIALGLVLLQMAGVRLPGDLIYYVAISMLAGAVLVFVGTKARHPAWLVLAVISLLCLLSEWLR